MLKGVFLLFIVKMKKMLVEIFVYIHTNIRK